MLSEKSGILSTRKRRPEQSFKPGLHLVFFAKISQKIIFLANADENNWGSHLSLFAKWMSKIVKYFSRLLFLVLEYRLFPQMQERITEYQEDMLGSRSLIT